MALFSATSHHSGLKFKHILPVGMPYDKINFQKKTTTEYQGLCLFFYCKFLIVEIFVALTTHHSGLKLKHILFVGCHMVWSIVEKIHIPVYEELVYFPYIMIESGGITG